MSGVFLHKDYVKMLGGDMLAASVLSQIVYWYLPTEAGGPKLRVAKQEDGRQVWWLAKSHIDWEDELGITRKQSRKALDRLKKLGIIETTIHRFNGSPTTHIRLCAAQGGAMFDKAPTAERLQSRLAHSGPVHFPTVGPIQCPQKGQTLTETTTETTTEKKPATQNQEEQSTTKNNVDTKKYIPKNSENIVSIGEENKKIPELEVIVKCVELEKGAMNVKQVLEKHTGRAHNSLGGFWQSRLSLVSEGTLKPLGMKELGQLKKLANALGEDVREVLGYTIEHWDKFAGKAAAQAGTSFPTVPHLGFLLSHYNVAVDLWKNSLKSSGKPVEKPMQSIAKPSTPVPSSKPTDGPTQQDVWEFIQSLG